MLLFFFCGKIVFMCEQTKMIVFNDVSSCFLWCSRHEKREKQIMKVDNKNNIMLNKRRKRRKKQQTKKKRI